MTSATTIQDLHALLVDFRDRRDWQRFHTPKDLAMSVSIESAELLELFQWKTREEVSVLAQSDEFRAKVADEIADVLIYLVLLSGELGVDLVEAARAKIATNEARFPPKESA